MRRLETFTVVSSFLVLALLGCSKGKTETSSGAAAATSVASSVPALKNAPSNEKLKTCAECEAATACTELTNPCGKFTGDQAAQCESVKECVLRTGCGQGEHTFTSCYCGDKRTADCLAAPLQGEKSPQGACRDVLSKAYGELKSSTDLLTRYIETEYPGGAALARLNCLKLNCQRECSFDKAGPVTASAATPK
jgi:hypothetical protein